MNLVLLQTSPLLEWARRGRERERERGREKRKEDEKKIVRE